MAHRLFESAVHAATYAQFRPRPPSTLLDAISKYLGKSISKQSNGQFKAVADVGCGIGQGTQAHAKNFQQVYGFDISAGQIDEAIRINSNENVNYAVAPAEKLPLSDASVELITCFQSFHWFDEKKFYKEASRVLVDNGVVALIPYEIPVAFKVADENSQQANQRGDSKSQQLPSTGCKHDSEVYNLIRKFYTNAELEAHWPKRQMAMIDSGYRDVKLPFRDVHRQTGFTQSVNVDGTQMLGYIQSWAAYQALQQSKPEVAKQLDKEFENDVKHTTGLSLAESQFSLEFYFHLLMGRK